MPDEIFKNISVLTAESEEQERYMELLTGNPTLGRGELESIAICMHIHTVLKMLLKTGLCSEKDMMDIVKKIEKTDRRTIKLELILAQA